MTSRRQVWIAALGIGVLLAAVVGFGLLSRPPAPMGAVEIESLDQAVEVGLLDAQVLTDLRSDGEARAIVHLDTAAILDPIRRALGEDRAAVLIDAMTAAFKANKATLAATFGPDVVLLRDFDRLGALVVTVRSEDALLAALRGQLVREVTTDRQYSPTSFGTHMPGPGLGLAAPSIFEGAGVAIGVLDTGVDDARYPAYFPASSVAGRLEAAPEDGVPDSLGHGTHVASTVLLMAPQAKVYSADVFRLTRVTGYADLQERAYQTDTLAAMDWLIGLKQSGVNIRAVNLSLGAGHHPPTICTDDAHFAEAYAAGIIPVVSAGNSAFTDDADRPTATFQPGLSGHACNEFTLSVGAVSNGSCLDAAVDTVAPFSQSGEGLDILAPGMCIVAAGGPLSGTSMAAPHVAGAVAVLANAKPDATAFDIWTALVGVGPVITDPNSGVARRRLDIPAAVDFILGTVGPRPTPVPAVVRGVAVGVQALSPTGALRPSERFEFEPVAVRNVGTVDATYSIVVEPPTGGFITPAPAAWFAVEPGSMALAAGSLGEVRIVVRPPDDALPGVYAAVLRIADPAASEPEAGEDVDISFVVFGDGEDGGTSGSPGGSDDTDDLGELLENPVVIIVGIVLVVWAMRRLFGGRRPPANPPVPPG